MRTTLTLSLGLLLLGTLACAPPADEAAPNVMTTAVAWKQTAAEYEALYHQGFNIARMRVEHALEDRRAAGDTRARPLAVIADVDDTVLDTRDYWREMLSAGRDLFDDTHWDEWVANQAATPTPGAVEFLAFCRDAGVEVFYITNRDQGARTLEFALANLAEAGVPFADEAHLTVLIESSNKESRQAALAEDWEIVVYLGDNLNDFRRDYYVADVDERRQLMTDSRDEFGQRFVLFPNPTDGHWIRAIFGDSEPPPTAETLAELQRRAAGR